MNIMNAPLEEGLVGELMRSIYPASTSPFAIDSVGSLRAILEMYVPEHEEWGITEGSKPVDFFIKEFEDRENVLSLITWLGKEYVLRDIRTATLYVTTSRSNPKPGAPNHVKKLRLNEFHLRNGVMVPRRYNNSMSEKLSLDEPVHLHAAIRALRQELGINPRPEHLVHPYLIPSANYPNIIQPQLLHLEKPRFIYQERDVRDTKRYPGILTRNELEHFTWHMPEEYFDPDGYKEEGKEHYFFWEPI